MRLWQSFLQFTKKLKLPLILQEERAECGHACIAMIACYWGRSMSLARLRRFNQASIRGTNLRQMTNLCHQLDLNPRVLRVSLEEIHLIKTPAILHWDGNHFVVLKQIKNNKIILHDPALGIRKLRKKEFAQSFSGVVLEMEKTPQFKTQYVSLTHSLWNFLTQIKGMPQVLTWVLMMSLIIECLQIINPLFMQYVTDNVLGSNALQQMYMLGIGCVLFVLLQGLAEFLRSHLILYTSFQITESFAASLFKHLLHLPLTFFSHRHLSDLQAKFQTVDQLKNKLSTDLIQSFLDGAMVVFIFMVMFAYCKILAAIIAVIFLIYCTALYLNFMGYKVQVASAMVVHAKTARSFFETFQGMSSVKTYAKENQRFLLWRNDYIEALNHDVQVTKVQIRYRILNQVLFHFEYILLICVGANLIMQHQLTVGMLLAFLAYRMLLVNKATALIQYFFAYQILSVQFNRLQDLIEQEPEVMHTSAHPTDSVSGSIELQQINFTYPGQEQMILQNIHFHIKAGEKVAIIGPSGYGKTTLLKIMMGLEEPCSGAILIDQMPLNLFGRQQFRQLSASVMQEDHLFTGSILDNITFFAEEVDINEVYAAAKIACLHEVILSFKMGYETLISQVHSNLSGGQKQRLLLARALYKKPKFLFLDEATSHLDGELERTINLALKELNMTQIIVAHRKETIAMADRVINLEILKTVPPVL